MINKNRLIKLTRDLIRIDSQNPTADEFAIAKFVEGFLKKLGISSRIYEFKKSRSNIVSVIEGRNKTKSLLITPHLDTVPAGKGWSFDPFAGKLTKDKIFGLGATDCKCNLACAMEAINSLVEEKQKLDYNLIFAATADEESGSEFGLIPLLKKGILKPDAALVLDSDDFEITVAQKGLLHIKVKIHGKKAHGAYPWLGLNAIDLSLEILKEVKDYISVVVKTSRRNPYLREPTVNIGTIKGGDKVNVVADWCEFELDFRYLPGALAGDIIARLKAIVKKYSKDFQVEIEGVQKPYLIEEKHILVKCLYDSIRAVKVKPVISGSEGATVITFFQDKKIPAVATGFGCAGCAHTVDEYVKINNIYKGAQALRVFLTNFKFF